MMPPKDDKDTSKVKLPYWYAHCDTHQKADMPALVKRAWEDPRVRVLANHRLGRIAFALDVVVAEKGSPVCCWTDA